MSLFDPQDVCIAIGSIATLDLPMVVDLIGIYGLKGPYCTLTRTDWFLQALSVIPRGSWGDAARRFTMIRWANHCIQFRKLSRSIRSDRSRRLPSPLSPPPPPPPRFRRKFVSGQLDEENPFVLISSVLLVHPDEGGFWSWTGLAFIYRNLPRRAGFFSDRSKSGSTGLLFSRPFFLYLFRRHALSLERIVKEATLCSLLEFEHICFPVQVSDLVDRDLVVVIVAQKVKVRA
ncbi:hypothetical protein F511_31109 [Dorcoceras hygrometricum]|uniref:Uncharacterized protein n=1 Tax=Dorcoceras hygrometricum TaxID=472368 RepID=A0A2Z7BGH6_9LAMI|nr:hypothetical protein F511_31109 [Dorcoceras hygrometricum]